MQRRTIVNLRRQTRDGFERSASSFWSEFIEPWGARFLKISQKKKKKKLLGIRRIGQLESQSNL